MNNQKHRNDLVSKLFIQGVSESVARELVETHPEEVQRQLDALPFREKIKNAAAYLIKAIREHYPLPVDLDEKKARAEKARQAEQTSIEKRAREEQREKYAGMFSDYLRSEMDLLEELQPDVFSKFQDDFKRMMEGLNPDYTESFMLLEFENFIGDRPGLDIFTFWEWYEQLNPDKEDAQTKDDKAPESEVSSEAKEEKKTLRSKKVDLIELVQQKVTLFHDLDYKHYATVEINGHVETYAIESKNFRNWLSFLYFEETGRPLFGEIMKEACAILQAHAQYYGETKEVSLRLAEHNGRIYLDLCDSAWRVVEISSEGWKVISGAESPVKFCRRLAMMPLPEPIGGGRLDELRNFMNAGDDETWTLIVSWLVMTLHPTGPYPLLMVTGEQGSAKSTGCRLLRSLVDPNRADLRALPKDQRDLMIGASNSWILAYDNLSGISQEVADSLCRIATGAGFTTRQLHSDNEESIFSVKRPIMTNGIIDANNYPDLLDRSVAIFMKAIDNKQRREELELWGTFKQAKPRILGALLSAVSHALKNRESVTLTLRPRMADFARWATAAEEGAGLPPGAFSQVFEANCLSNHETALDNPLAIALSDFLESLPEASWSGTATDLYMTLNSWVTQRNKIDIQISWWPKSPAALTGKLRRLAPNFRAKGWEVHSGHTNCGSRVTLNKVVCLLPFVTKKRSS